MLFSIIGLILVFAHVWGATKYLQALDSMKLKADELSLKAESYRNSGNVVAQINEEIEWLARNEPAPMSYGDAETQLLSILQNEGQTRGLETEKPKFLRQDETEGKYRRARIQISATASEAQIYEWIVAIHKPTVLRAVTQVQLQPDKKDETQVVCTIVAEQWLVEREDDAS